MYTEYMYKDSLAHFGIRGQKWGVRRFQNPDGTLTPEGRARYGIKSGDSATTKKMKKDLATLNSNAFKKKYKISNKDYMKSLDKGKALSADEIRKRKNIKKAVAIGAGVALAGTAAIAGRKYLKNTELLNKLMDEATKDEDYYHAKELVNMYKNHPLSFDKKVERNNLRKSLVGRYELAYKRAKNEYKANPTSQNKEKLKEAADRYIGFNSSRMSTKELRKLENISKQYTHIERKRSSNNDVTATASKISKSVRNMTDDEVKDLVKNTNKAIDKTSSKVKKSAADMAKEYKTLKDPGRLNDDIISRFESATSKSYHNMFKTLSNKYYNDIKNPVDKRKGLINLINQTGMSGSELENFGYIKMTGQEISEFAKQYPKLWKK